MKHKEKAEKQKSAAQKALLASLFKGVTQIQTNEDGEGKLNKDALIYDWLLTFRQLIVFSRQKENPVPLFQGWCLRKRKEV